MQVDGGARLVLCINTEPDRLTVAETTGGPEHPLGFAVRCDELRHCRRGGEARLADSIGDIFRSKC